MARKELSRILCDSSTTLTRFELTSSHLSANLPSLSTFFLIFCLQRFSWEETSVDTSQSDDDADEDEGDNDVVEKDVSDNLVSALDPWFRLFFEFTLTSIGECLALLSGESISSPKESDCGEVGGWPAL